MTGTEQPSVGSRPGIRAQAADWWRSGTSPRVKLVYLVLVANGLPAFVLLTFLPGHTDTLFVWTVKPPASAQVLGVMYTDALVLVVIGALQPSWARARITVLLIAYFAVAATTVTLFNLDPFLKHPWTHLAFWLSMYVLLVLTAPAVFLLEERRAGGRLKVEVPMTNTSRAVGGVSALVFGGLGLALLIGGGARTDIWPWMLTPLVARILGVWFTAVAITYAWALWDGDWLRVRPIYWQAIPIGAFLALVPLLQSGDVRSDAGPLVLYIGLAVLMVGGGLLTVATQRGRSVE